MAVIVLRLLLSVPWCDIYIVVLVFWGAILDTLVRIPFPFGSYRCEDSKRKSLGDISMLIYLSETDTYWSLSYNLLYNVIQLCIDTFR